MNRRRFALTTIGLLGALSTLTGFRPDDPDSTGLFRFEPGYDIDTYDSDGGRVRVHFTREGPDAVRPADSNHNDTPDAVEIVANTYEEVLTFYADLGYRSPASDLDTPQGDGGSDRLDVYLVDFGGASDGAFVRDRCDTVRPVCSGYVAQENDYAGYGYPSFGIATRILSSHELFHAVQAAYDADQGANWSEATAVWGSEHFDPSLHDFEAFIGGWLDESKRSIDQEPIGPVDSYSYGLAIFAQFLSERYGDDLHLFLWQDLEDGANGVGDPQWLPTLADLLASEYGASFDDAWVEFAEWVIRSGVGGPAGTTFANAASYPKLGRKLVTAPYMKERLRVYHASMQAWALVPAGRARISAALASEDAEELEGLSLILAVRRGGAIESVVFGPEGGSVDASGADEVIAVVANYSRTGGSRRPGLCLGDEGEVSACVMTLAPQDPEPVAEEGADGFSGADTSDDEADALDAGGDDLSADTAPAPSPTADDGCAGGASPSGALLALLALLIGALAVRTSAGASVWAPRSEQRRARRS